ncbi:MAG: CBS domain-containing protein [Alphaproteobacteria bacterium]|nr:CBS domain-containing protein [Alphaproteobacteria bacterium]MBU1517238.1 CBS domain-containing protein [Alphaproteobacteria bacterium]MBU2093226.1 CBS domain-containing protein [Alphaproteobacteria bacterium]MBU2153148.1 CBS domain-containing protein [Alphaproteobacteria bacterium]MBU2307854.1 CBS domain-containing protein [Alphaproteobacteria bacterium]
MNVSEVMTAQVATATPRSTIAEVARTMVQVESGVVPVVDDGKVVGMITDRDIVIRVVAEGLGLDTPVAKVMTDEVETCREDDNVADAAAKMGSKQIRRLAVLNDQGKLAGIISLGDIAIDYGAKKVGQTLEEISESTPAAH